MASSSLVGSLSSLGLNASILHGEVYALILSFLLSMSSSSPISIFSDHLPSVRYIASAPAVPSSLYPSFASSPACSLYQWLWSLVIANPHCSVQHIHAHTSSTAPASLTNKLVDLYATSAQRQTFMPPPVPVPSFTMDQFTPFHPSFGYVKTNLSSFVPHLLAFVLSQDSSFHPLQHLPYFLYDSHPPPTHPYLHATSAFAAALQLYLRSAQLDTADIHYRWLGDTALCCHMGCAAIETTHHIFVQCSAFNEIQGSHLQALVQATGNISKCVKLLSLLGKLFRLY